MVLALLLGYLLGSIPVAYLVARAWGVNILRVGTGNPGAANVFRQVGPAAGGLVFAGDIAKAAAAMWVAKEAVGISEWGSLAVGVAALMGHWFPLFLRFRGGAGLGPSMGVGFGVHPLAAAIGALVGLLVVWRVVHSSSHAVAVGFAVFLVVAPLLGLSFALTLAVVAVPLLVAPRRYLLPWVAQRLRAGWAWRANRLP